VIIDADLAAFQARATEYCRREAAATAQEILSEDRGVNFSFGLLVLITMAAERRLRNPSATDMQRITAAWIRWDRAGRRRLARRAR